LLNTDIEIIADNLSEILKKFDNKKILMPGGMGFLGKYFINFFDHIIKKYNFNTKVYVLDTLISSDNFYTRSFIQKLSNNIIFENKDITSNIKVIDYDYIINLAGIASPYYYNKFPLETIDVNTKGLRNILEIALKAKSKVLYFSSSEIYGNPSPENIPTKETYNGNVSSYGSRSCYDESKRLGETLCYIYSKNYKVDINIVRPFNVYGPGMSKYDYRVMPNFINQIVNDKPCQVYSNGMQTRTYCYITDAITGFLKVLVLGKSGSIYNIGNNNPELSILDLCKKFKKIQPKRFKYEIVDYPNSYPDDEPRRRCPDISLANKDLNYYPTVNIDEGLETFIKWSLENFKDELS
jgi:UDP-glucuronate decarboxylase